MWDLPASFGRWHATAPGNWREASIPFALGDRQRGVDIPPMLPQIAQRSQPGDARLAGIMQFRAVLHAQRPPADRASTQCSSPRAG